MPARLFQCLENRSRNFPMFGKPPAFFSNVWKTCVALAALLVLAVAAAAAPLTVEQATVVRVYYPDRAVLNAWAATLDIWEVHRAEQYFVARVRPDQYEALVRSGLPLEIDAEKTARMYVPRRLAPAGVTGIPDYTCYRTVEETYTTMALLASNYPTLAVWTNIGVSWKRQSAGGTNGFAIKVLQISNRAVAGPKPRFFLNGAIHAREYSTAEAATRFAEQLLQQYGKDPDITAIVDFYEVHIVPQCNPDGRKIAETGCLQRKNINYSNGGSCGTYPPGCGDYGTDLNRNANFKWGVVGSSTYSCDELYQGPTAASEPEEQAIETYMTNLFASWRGSGDTDVASTNATGLMITLHSYGDLVLFPWGWTGTLAPNHYQLQTLGRKFAFYNRYSAEPSGSGLYYASGCTDDWLYGRRGVAAYTFEMGSDFFEPCSSFESTIWPSNYPAFLYACKASRRPYVDPAGPDTWQITVAPTSVTAGASVTLRAKADATRYSSSSENGRIKAARFSFDVPSWSTGVVLYAMTAVDGSFNANAETVTVTFAATNLSPGRHLVWIESQGTNGRWGVPSAAFVTVAAALSVTLNVSSAHGTPYPAAGQHLLAAGTTVTARVNGSPATAGTTQYLCRGWTGSGSAPATGTTTNIPAFVLSNTTTIAWQWLTNYWVALGTNGCGTVTPVSAWQRRGTNLAVAASAAPYFHFVQWQGDAPGGQETNPALSLTVSAPASLTARFDPDLATNSTPKWWLASYGWTNNFDAAATNDVDQDGYFTWQEHITGTIPTSHASRLQFDALTFDSVNCWIRFPSVSNRRYDVQASTDLRQPAGWTPLATNLPGHDGVESVADSLVWTGRFYRIRAYLP